MQLQSQLQQGSQSAIVRGRRTAALAPENKNVTTRSHTDTNTNTNTQTHKHKHTHTHTPADLPRPKHFSVRERSCTFRVHHKATRLSWIADQVVIERGRELVNMHSFHRELDALRLILLAYAMRLELHFQHCAVQCLRHCTT